MDAYTIEYIPVNKCNEVYLTKNELKVHDNIHYSDVICGECGKGFKTIPKAEEHIKCNHSEMDEVYFNLLNGGSMKG